MESNASPCGDDFDAAFARNFALAGFILNRFLVHHLLRMARQTKGDFESLVIWSSLALQNTAGLLGPGARPVTPLQPDGTFPDSLLRANWLRSSDLAQITGIPRETVRRKLERLQTGGVSFEATYLPITPLIANIVFGDGVTFTAQSVLSVEYSCPNTTFTASQCPKQP